MKCPHCGRTWDDQEFVQEGLSPTVVLHEHVQRFCPGSPEHSPVTRGVRPVPTLVRSRTLLEP
jgi:hypothetical protein